MVLAWETGKVFAKRWMKLEPIIQSEVRKKNTNIVYINAYIWNLERW